MQKLTYCPDFSVLRDAYIVKPPDAPLGPTRFAFHAQIFRGIYPPDAKIRQRLKVEGRPPKELVAAEYLAFLLDCKARGDIEVRRLVILPDTDEECEYQQKVFARTRAAGEDIRATPFARQRERLVTACGRTAIVQSYLQGADEGISRESFWAVSEGAHDPHVVWRMSYDANGKFLGGPVSEAPFEPEVASYVQFWQNVHQSSESLPVMGLPS